MNIIFLLNSRYPNYTGGRETWIYNVCNRLCVKHNISIITEKNFNKDNDDGVFTEIDPRIKIYSVKTLNNFSIIRPFLRSYLSWINQEISAKLMQNRLKKILLNSNKDEYIIITMDTVFMGKIGSWAKKNFINTKYISSVRGPHAEITGEYYPILKNYFIRVEKNNLELADQIWSNGWDTKDSLKQKGFNSIVIKNGLDISRAYEVSEELYNDLPLIGDYNIITIGSLLDIKGYPELIRAIKILHKNYNLKVNLIALGKGNPKRYLDLAKNLEIVEYINFVGEKRATIEYAQKCDLAVSLSGGGGLSMACLESMASRTPVVAWDSQVYRQMITHKSSGYLVEENNINALAEGIYWMLNHRAEAEKMGDEAFNFVKKFDWNIVVEDIEKQLNSLRR